MFKSVITRVELDDRGKHDKTTDGGNSQSYIVCTLSLSAGGLSLQPYLEKGGELDRTSTFRGGLLGRRGGEFFQGGGEQLSHNKLKSEIFNEKKSL